MPLFESCRGGASGALPGGGAGPPPVPARARAGAGAAGAHAGRSFFRLLRLLPLCDRRGPNPHRYLLSGDVRHGGLPAGSPVGGRSPERRVAGAPARRGSGAEPGGTAVPCLQPAAVPADPVVPAGAAGPGRQGLFRSGGSGGLAGAAPGTAGRGAGETGRGSRLPPAAAGRWGSLGESPGGNPVDPPGGHGLPRRLSGYRPPPAGGAGPAGGPFPAGDGSAGCGDAAGPDAGRSLPAAPPT